MQNQITVSLPAVAIARLTAAVAALPGTRFVGVTYRSKESGELARHTLIMGADYAKTVTVSADMLAASAGPEFSSDVSVTRALEKSIAECAVKTPERKRANAALALFQATIGAERAARAELFISLLDTLAAQASGQENSRFTKAGLYESICPGLKVSRADGSFELCGLAHAKTVLEAGVYPAVNSSAKTIAKNALRAALPIGKFRTLALDVGALESVRIGGTEIDVQDI